MRVDDVKPKNALTLQVKIVLIFMCIGHVSKPRTSQTTLTVLYNYFPFIFISYILEFHNN